MPFSENASVLVRNPDPGFKAPLRSRIASRRVPLVELDFLIDEDESVGRQEADSDIDLRQLRHHTKNALQRIMGLVAQAPGCSTRRRASISPANWNAGFTCPRRFPTRCSA